MNAQQLKNSILQMAVQGKLVPQDPNDEPASVLLGRIRAEKEKLIKEGKIKKEKNPSYIFRGEDNLPYEKVGKVEPVCIADEVPFEIPDSWEWVKLRNIAISDLGKTLDKAKNTGKLRPYLCSINVYWDGIDLSKVKEAKFEDNELEKYRLLPGDLLICEGGDVGRSAVWNSEKEMYYQNALHRVRFFGGVNPLFFHIVLECYKGNRILDEYSKGMTIKHLVQSSLNSILFPLPPLEEQKRIVEKISSITPFLNQYNKLEIKLTELNEEFPIALKKSILQQAVMGKLVPQDPNDEPASVLLERIRAEKQELVKAGKLKKDKHESIIYRRDNSHYEKLDGFERCIDDEIPFDIPESWCWCRLNTLAIIQSSKRVFEKDYVSDGVPFYRSKEIGDLYRGETLKTELYISDEHYADIANKYGVPQAGDILITSVGTIGNTWICDGRKFYYKDGNITQICSNNAFESQYVEAYLHSPYFDAISKSTVAGTAYSALTIEKLKKVLIPLPPLSEQHRIVSEIKMIIAILHKLI